MKNKNEIIEFPVENLKREKLTDADIKSLFMGLVNLVKKTAIEDATEKLNNSADSEFTKTVQQLNMEKEKNIELKKINSNLNSQLAKLKEKLMQIRAIKLNELINKE